MTVFLIFERTPGYDRFCDQAYADAFAADERCVALDDLHPRSDGFYVVSVEVQP